MVRVDCLLRDSEMNPCFLQSHAGCLAPPVTTVPIGHQFTAPSPQPSLILSWPALHIRCSPGLGYIVPISCSTLGAAFFARPSLRQMPIATPSPMPSERLGDSGLKLSIPHLGIIFARRCNCNNDDNDEENTHTRQSTEYQDRQAATHRGERSLVTRKLCR